MGDKKDQIPHNLPTDNTQTDVHYSSIEQSVHTYPLDREMHEKTEEPEKEKAGADKAIKYALVIGFLVILFVVSLGIVSFLPSIISNVSTTASTYLFSTFSSQPKITLTLDKNEVGIGQPFTLSWKNNTTDTNGSYSFSFKCTEGITLVDASSSKPIVCGTYYPIGSDNWSIKLISNSKNTGSVSLPMNVSFFETNRTEPKLTNSISILALGTNGNNSGSSNNSSTSTNSGVTVTSQNNSQNNSSGSRASSSNYYYPANGKSDLAITLVKSGMVVNNGSFVQTSAINAGSRVMIQFNVANNGTAPSGAWSLTATLPTTIQNEKTYSSGTEPSLKPGDSFTMSLAFDSFDSSANQAIITLLSSADSNVSNNTLTIPFTAGSTYSNNNNYNYNNNYYNSNGNYYNNNASLNVAITNLGQFNRSTGQFYYNGYNSSIYSGSTVGVQFTVTNNGSTATGPWSFNATLPTNSNSNYNNNYCNGYNCNNNYYNNNGGTYNYSSGTEPSLAPGQSMSFTIAFDNPTIGSDTVYINAYGSSVSGGNNSATRTFYVSN